MSFTPNVLPAPIYDLPAVRAVAGAPATLTLAVTDPATGLAVDADVTPAPAVAVTDGAGVAITVPAPAHSGAAGSGTYTVTLPARTHPDTLTVTWSWTLGGQAYTAAQPLKVVGQRLVDLPTLKADPTLSSVAAATLLSVMGQVEDAFDQVLGFPCVPVGERLEWWVARPGVVESFPTVTGLPYGLGPPRLLVPEVSRPLYVIDAEHWFGPIADLNLVKVGNTGCLEYADGRPWPPGPYRFWLVHGMNPPPGDLRQAASTLIRYLARTDSNVPERAASVTSGGSTIVVALPTPDRPTGLPSVDVVLNRYRQGGAGGIAI